MYSVHDVSQKAMMIRTLQFFFESIKCVIYISLKYCDATEKGRKILRNQNEFHYAFLWWVWIWRWMCVCMYVDCRYRFMYIYSSVANTLNFHSLYFKRWFGEVDDSLTSPCVKCSNKKFGFIINFYLSLLAFSFWYFKCQLDDDSLFANPLCWSPEYLRMFI